MRSSLIKDRGGGGRDPCCQPHPQPPILSVLLTGLGYQVGDDIVHSQWVGEKHSHGGVQAKAPPRVVILP